MGLGKMGLGMAARLAAKGHSVIGYDVAPQAKANAEAAGIVWAGSPAELAEKVASPRTILIMVPAGEAVDAALNAIAPHMTADDVIIEGGNSLYKDSMRRAEQMKNRGLRFLDVGVSGGVWGRANGYCMMAGGDEKAFQDVEQFFVDLCQENGYAHVGRSGAGHFSKMVHNGIEYGMLQAYGEGFEILEKSGFDFDLAQLSSLWNSGSVVRSWLLELAQMAFEESPELANVQGWVEDSGEGRWTVLESIEERVPAPVIALSLMMRFRSRQDDSFSAKVIAALRQKFGGHSVKDK